MWGALLSAAVKTGGGILSAFGNKTKKERQSDDVDLSREELRKAQAGNDALDPTANLQSNLSDIATQSSFNTGNMLNTMNKGGTINPYALMKMSTQNNMANAGARLDAKKQMVEEQNQKIRNSGNIAGQSTQLANTVASGYTDEEGDFLSKMGDAMSGAPGMAAAGAGQGSMIQDYFTPIDDKNNQGTKKKLPKGGAWDLMTPSWYS